MATAPLNIVGLEVKYLVTAEVGGFPVYFQVEEPLFRYLEGKLKEGSSIPAFDDDNPLAGIQDRIKIQMTVPADPVEEVVEVAEESETDGPPLGPEGVRGL